VSADVLDEFVRPERRRHQRANVPLSGRYMLTDRHEYDCKTIDISSSGVAVLGPIKGAIGERVVAYFDRIGRVEGMIIRHFGACFAIELRACTLRRDKLDLQIESLVEQQTKGAWNRRRIAPSA
jgi:PilZ domain